MNTLKKTKKEYLKWEQKNIISPAQTQKIIKVGRKWLISLIYKKARQYNPID